MTGRRLGQRGQSRPQESVPSMVHQPGHQRKGGVQGMTISCGTQSVLVMAAINKLCSITTIPLMEGIKWQLSTAVTKDKIAGQMELKMFMLLHHKGSKGRSVSLLHSIAQCFFAPGQAHGTPSISWVNRLASKQSYMAEQLVQA